MGRSGKGMSTSLMLRTRSRLTKKDKARTSNNEVSTQYFMRIIEEFKDILSLWYRKIQVKNYSTEAYFSYIDNFMS